MSEQIKVGRLARDFHAADVSITRADDAEPMRLSFPASSETPVDRWFGTEILRHDAKSIRMDRMNSGAAPLLFNHNWDDPIGMIDRATLKDGRLWVDAHLFDTARAREVAAMVNGGMRNVSIGYELHEVTEDTKKGTFTATDWGVLEVSFATVPADPSVGVGRDADSNAKTVRLVRAAEVSTPAAPAAKPKESNVDHEVNEAAAGTSAEQQQQQTRSLPAQPRQGDTGSRAMDMEQARVRGIENLCRANKIEDGIRNVWVSGGVSMEAVSEELLNILEQRGKSNPQSEAKLGLGQKETREYSLMNAIRACADKNWGQAGFELECSREIAKRLNTVTDPNKFYVPFEVQQRGNIVKRDATVASASGGGYLVGTQNMSFIELLRNRSVAYRMGARRLAGLVGNVTIPRHTAAATAYWLASESTQVTESQQTYGQLALSPKTVGAYTEISRQLMLQSSPDAESIVSSDLAQVAALAVDVGVLRGSGADGQPQGIVGTSGLGSVTATSVNYAKVLEFQTDVASANVEPVAGGYVTTPAVAAILMATQKFSGTDTPLWVGNVWGGQMCGFQGMATNQMSSGTMLFGDWSQVVVAEWGILQVEVNPYANFQAGIIGVRAMVSIDSGLRYAGAFSYASSVTAA